MTRRRPRPVAAGVAVAALAALLGGCAGGTVVPGAAEIVADGPDCLATDVLWGLGIEPPAGHDRDAPTAGSVPAGFEPVAVVECRGGIMGLDVGDIEPAPMLAPESLPGGEATLLPPPGPPAVLEERTDPDQPGEPATPAAPATPVPVTVTEVELRGDLAPLLADLARPSRTPSADQACPAMMEYQPQVYLVDALGRAVRVQWPTDECRFLLAGVTDALTGLDEARRTPRTLPTP